MRRGEVGGISGGVGGPQIITALSPIRTEVLSPG